MTSPSTLYEWYSRVQVAPRPETGEAVTVGLIFGNGRPLVLEKMDNLPRLAALASPGDRRAFEFLVGSLAKRVENGQSLDVLRATMGPQVRISREIGFVSSPTERQVRMLVASECTLPQTSRLAREETKLVERSRKHLGKLVGAAIAVGARVEQNAGFEEVFGFKPATMPSRRVPQVSYALQHRNRDVLVDGILIEPSTADFAVRSATTRIGRAFWLYSHQLRSEIRHVAGHEIRIVGVLMAPRAESDPVVAEAHAYIRHAWAQDVDELIEGEGADARGQLREQTRWLVHA